MQLFCDIDGVLLNFERAFVRWLNRTHGHRLPEDYEAESWDFQEVLGPETMQAHYLAFLASEDVGRMAPLVEPARFNALAAQHRLHLVTNFPEPYMAKRLGNLRAHGFRYHSLHHCGLHAYQGRRPQTKAEVIAQLRRQEVPALFVDDHPDNCLDVHAHCPEVEVWLMSRRFNRDFRHPIIRRARDWGALFDRLDALPAAQGAATLTTAQFPAIARALERPSGGAHPAPSAADGGLPVADGPASGRPSRGKHRG